MAQVMTVVASGDAMNGWSVDIDDGVNPAVWTPPARDVEHAITQALADHFAKFGHNVPLAGAQNAAADREEMVRLKRQHEDDMSVMIEMKAEIARLKQGPLPKAEPAMSIAEADAKMKVDADAKAEAPKPVLVPGP